MTQDESEFIYEVLLNFFDILRVSFISFFFICLVLITINGIIINYLRRILGDSFINAVFFFGGIMHSYWHIFAAKLLGYDVRHTFTLVWQRDDISSFGITLSDGRNPGKIKDAFIIGYAPIMNFALIIGLVLVRPFLRDNLIELVPPIDTIWLFLIINLLFVGLPDITDLILPIESLFAIYPFLAFEFIWGFFFGVFLYSALNAFFVTFLLLIYSLAAFYAESGSSFLSRKDRVISDPWEKLLIRTEV